MKTNASCVDSGISFLTSRTRGFDRDSVKESKYMGALKERNFGASVNKDFNLNTFGKLAEYKADKYAEIFTADKCANPNEFNPKYHAKEHDFNKFANRDRHGNIMDEYSKKYAFAKDDIGSHRSKFLSNENLHPSSRAHSRQSSAITDFDFKASRADFNFKALSAKQSIGNDFKSSEYTLAPMIPTPIIQKATQVQLPAFSTIRLKPLVQETKYGTVQILQSGSLLLDFKQEKYLIKISGNSETVMNRLI